LRGRAMGLTMAGVSFCGLTLPALFGVMIERYGWRSAYITAGGLITALALPAVLLLLLDDPGQLGQYPDGASQPPATIHTALSGATFGQAIRSRALWTLAACGALCYIEHGVIALQVPAMLQDTGLPASVAASFLGFMLGVSAIGRLAVGSLADRFDRARILGVCLLGMALGALTMMWPANALARIGYIFIYGISSGGTFTILPVIAQWLFGLRAFGKVFAVVILATTLATAAGNYLGARIYDWRGDYSAAVWVAVSAAALAGLLAFTLRPRTWEQE